MPKANKKDNPVTDFDDAETPDIVKETLAGDLRDHMLDLVRNLQKPWQEMTEEEQTLMADNVQIRAKSLVRRAVKVIAADGRNVVDGTLKKVTITDCYQCVIDVSKTTDLRHAIADAAGTSVLLVVSNDEDYMGERGPVEIDPDQPGLLEEYDADVA